MPRKRYDTPSPDEWAAEGRPPPLTDDQHKAARRSREAQERWDDTHPRLSDRDRERYTIEGKKAEHERLMETATPRPPEGPIWEAMKENNPGIHEKDLQLLLTLAMDYVWTRAIRYKEPKQGTWVDIPPELSQYKRLREETPSLQYTFLVRGRIYLLTADFATKKDADREVEVSDPYMEFGLLPGEMKDRAQFDDRLGYVDLTKLPSYHQIVSTPEGPTYPERGDSLSKQEQIRSALSHLVGKAWDLRQLLFSWLGIMISDESFAQHIDIKLQSVLTDQKRVGDLAVDVYVLQNVERMQVAMLLDLVNNSGISFKKLFGDKNTIDTKEARALINAFKDLPGFRAWANEVTGTVKISPHAARDRRYADAGGGDSLDYSFLPLGDSPVELTLADREFLTPEKPKHKPSIFDGTFDRLLPEVKAKLKGDLSRILEDIEVERTEHPDHAQWLSFTIALLKDGIQNEVEKIKSYPVVVASDRNIRDALLLGARHVVCVTHPAFGKAKQNWEASINKLGQITGREIIKGESGRLDSYTTEIDFGNGTELVVLEFIEQPSAGWDNPQQFYQSGQLPYRKLGAVIDHAVNINYGERGAFLRQLVPGGIFISTGDVYSARWGSGSLSLEDSQEVRSVVNGHNQKSRADLEKTITDIWRKDGFTYLSLPNYPDLKFTVVQKQN